MLAFLISCGCGNRPAFFSLSRRTLIVVFDHAARQRSDIPVIPAFLHFGFKVLLFAGRRRPARNHAWRRRPAGPPRLAFRAGATQCLGKHATTY